jgi:hypothetical protein
VFQRREEEGKKEEKKYINFMDNGISAFRLCVHKPTYARSETISYCNLCSCVMGGTLLLDDVITLAFSL